MKKLLLSLALLASIGTLKAQNVYNYGFTTGNAGLATDGWQTTNQSNPATVRVWTVPAAVFTTTFDGGAQSLPASSFAIVDYTSVGVLIAGPVGSSGSGPISNWLISPEITVKNGDVISFYTRKALISTSTTAVDYPDRLQLRMSTDGAFTINPSTGPTDIGTFSTLLVDVNPTLVAGVYPRTWTKYSYTVVGIATPTSVKFAFRYFVTSGGAEGANSDRIGLDTFSVDTPEACAPPTVIVASSTNSTGSTISWTAPATAPANGYEYYYSTTNTAPTAATVASGNAAAGIVTATLTGLMNNTSYYVWVRSVCSASEKSSWSATFATFNTTPVPGCATITAPLNAATGIVLTLVDGTGTGAGGNGYPVGTRFTSTPIAWTSPTSGGVIVGFNIYVGLTAANLTLFGTITSASATGVNIPGLLYGTTYYWNVVPTNAGGQAVGCNTIFSFTTAPATSCLNNDYAKYPAATYTPVNVDGTPNIIAADCWGGEYSEVTVTASQTYEFSSSVATDYITISKDGGLTSVASGITPVLYTNTTAGTVRFYTHLNNRCEDSNVNRSRIVKAGGALATDTFSSANFKSFPNPVKDVLNLSYDKDITNVTVINLLGQEVLTSKVNNTTAKIDMSGLTTGAYMVKVTSDNEVKTIKVIKE